jgi:hypothetical protein
MVRPQKKHKPINMKFNKVLENLADSFYLSEKQVVKKLLVKKKKK